MKQKQHYIPNDNFDDWAEEVEDLISLEKWESYEKYATCEWRKIEKMYNEGFSPDEAHNKIMMEL